MSGELLLELRSEEIPARMQRRAIADFVGLVRDKLAAAGIPAGEIRGYVTPRRLVVIAQGIPAAQPDRSEERRGPRLGAPQPAIDGFLRAAGLGSVEQCEVRDTGRGEFYFAVIRRAGRPAAEVLPELLGAAIGELSWPKSMRWPGAALRWVRPLAAILCLYEGAVVPLAIDGVPVGRTTHGHRFLSQGEICAESAADYREKLENARVVLDQDRRRELIAAALDRRAAELGVLVKPDPGLLDEVTGLAEYPVVLAGAIDRDFMSLPPEVLQTAMRTHQKYFSCAYSDGRPAPHFLFVADNLASDGGKAIVAGNERVLRARLADARFFWDQDRKIRLEDRVPALKDRVYHAKLGSVLDKVERMEKLADFLAPYVPGADAELARRAARLAKADLSTGMVGEFPELQGIMGRYYVLGEGQEHRRTADAIADHYKPQGPNDACPTAPESVVVALADKIDALTAFFAVGEKPTGSRDPFALRRAALGMIRLVLEHQAQSLDERRLRLPFRVVFRESFKVLKHEVGSLRYQTQDGMIDPRESILDFLIDRMKVHLREHEFRHDIIAAASISNGLSDDDLSRLVDRAYYLREFLYTEDGESILTTFRRAASIVSIEENRDGVRYTGVYDKLLLQQPEERALARRLEDAEPELRTALAEEDFPRQMSILRSLRQPVDAFFQKITVNTAETVSIDGITTTLRENRLQLLARVRDTMKQVADFSKIEG